MKIVDATALEILDSRGNPTVRTIVELEDGSKHASSVPSGASTGTHEAVELRDNNNSRYNGKGVLKAVEPVNKVIGDAIVGLEADPKTIDQILIDLDATTDKSKLGANAILSVSMAVTRAAAHAENKPLWQFLREQYFGHMSNVTGQMFPRLMVNIINGGVHANWPASNALRSNAGWNFDIQEFMVVPNATLPSESIRVAAEIFHSLGALLRTRGLSTLVGDEGGYSPILKSNEEAFEVILEAAKNAGYENVKDYRLSLDVAATELFKDGEYNLHKPNRSLTSEELSSYYMLLTTHYKLLSIEDPFAEDDWEAWEKLTGIQPDLTIIGDDLFTTNPVRIKKGIEKKAANGVLIKLNQIGTVTETVEAINLARAANWKIAVSHRSGETEDSFIADLAYACQADFLKAGSMSRSERLSKYNRLLEIEKGL